MAIIVMAPFYGDGRSCVNPHLDTPSARSIRGIDLRWLLPVLAVLPFAGGYLANSPPRRARALAALWVLAAGAGSWLHHRLWLGTVVALALMLGGSRMQMRRCPAGDFETFSRWRFERHRCAAPADSGTESPERQH